MTKLTLFGGKGAGSTSIEAALRLAGIDHEFVDGASWGAADAHAKLRALNPTGQVPALILPSGEVMTESAAILLWIAEAAPEKRLAPPPGDAARPAFLRWLLFLAANFYATYAVSDRPERWVGEAAEDKKALVARAIERRRQLWAVMESAVAPAPFIVGADMTFLDVYAAMMSRWTPGRPWFEANCPKLLGAVKLTEENPVVAEVWARNFEMG